MLLDYYYRVLQNMVFKKKNVTWFPLLYLELLKFHIAFK